MINSNSIDKAIKHIILNHNIEEQIQLQQHLKEAGYAIPQATLSRRLHKLKIVKINGVYQLTNSAQSSLPPILNIQSSDTGIIVLHTQPGCANSIALFIDHHYVSFTPSLSKNTDILGTIAGDDTIVIILKDKDSAQKIISMLSRDLSIS